MRVNPLNRPHHKVILLFLDVLPSPSLYNVNSLSSLVLSRFSNVPELTYGLCMLSNTLNKSVKLIKFILRLNWPSEEQLWRTR